MAGRERSRLGLPKPLCRAADCRSVPANAGWTYCTYHFEREVQRLAVRWEQLVDKHGTKAMVRLPPIGKAVGELDREESAALGRLLSWQLHDLVLPTAIGDTDEAAA